MAGAVLSPDDPLREPPAPEDTPAGALLTRGLAGLPCSRVWFDFFTVLVLLSTFFGCSAVLLSGVLGQFRKWRRAGPWHHLPRALSCPLPASSLSPEVAPWGVGAAHCQENWGTAPPLGGLARWSLSCSRTWCFTGIFPWFRAQAPSPARAWSLAMLAGGQRDGVSLG